MAKFNTIFRALILLVSVVGYSQQEQTYSTTLTGSALNSGTINVQDPLFLSLGNGNTQFNVVNPAVYVHFGYQEELTNALKYNEIYYSEINLTVTTTPISGTGQVASITNHTLTIYHNNINNDFKLQDYAVLKFPGVHKANLQINSILYKDQNGAVISSFDQNKNSTYLKMSFETERYYNIASTKLNVSQALVDYNNTTEIVTPISNFGISNGEKEFEIKN